MHIVLRDEPIQDKSYQDLLSSVNRSVFSTYVYIFNKVQHTNFTYLKYRLPNTRSNFYKVLRQLESLGLISITLGVNDNVPTTKI